MRIRLTVPEVQSRPLDRPTRCPKCGGQILYKAQVHPRQRFIDTKLTDVATVRYGCSTCGKTFHHYPKGVTRKQQSARVVVLATLMYVLGLSYEATAKILELLGAGVCKVTVWRDVKELGLAARRRQHLKDWGKVRILGADETVFRVNGKEVVVGFVTNAETGDLLGADILIDRSAKGFVKWLKRYARRVGAEVVVTDDLATYRPALEELGLDHQVCLTHVLRNMSRRLREIEGYEAEKEKLRQVVKELPEDGGAQLLKLALEVKEAEPRLYSLALQLSERWQRLVLYKRIVGVPRTNNASERAIGPSKIRYKTMRGLKSYRGVLNLIALTGEIYGGASELHLEQALAA